MSAENPLIVIVDAGSTGTTLPAAINARGMDCFHVRSAESRGEIDAILGILSPEDDRFVGGLDERTCDLDAMAAILRERDVRGVVAGSEAGVDVATALAALLGVPGSGPSAPGLTRDKFLMARQVHTAGLATLPFRTVSAPEEARGWWQETLGEASVVVKPLRDSGGNGVIFCHDWLAIETAITRLTGEHDLYGSPNHTVLVQKLAVNATRIVEVCTVSAGGVHRPMMILESSKVGPIYECMRLVHRDELADYRAEVDYALGVLDALGVTMGAAFTEVIDEPGVGPVMIECNARLIGGFLDSRFCAAALGHSQVDLLADACTDPAGFAATDRSAGTIRHARLVHLRSDVAGVLSQDLSVLEALIEALPTRFYHRLNAAAGDALVETVDLSTSPGFVQLVGDDAGQVEADYRAIRAAEAGGVYRDAVGQHSQNRSDTSVA
ncbi:MAG: hypothetical protein ACI8RZ_003643 [Myxococcota bacterium]|jgi:hypothetical protein